MGERPACDCVSKRQAPQGCVLELSFPPGSVSEQSLGGMGESSPSCSVGEKHAL